MSDLLPFDRAPEPGRAGSSPRGLLWLVHMPVRAWREGRARLGASGDALGGLWSVAPLVALTLLFGQLTLGGIVPALRESQRLDAAELEVSSWERRLAEAGADAARHQRMLADPIWRERVRRSLRTAQGAPVRFEGGAVETR